MKNYKRRPIDREVTFKAPYYECHACNDSGIIHNSDGLINQHLPDYDIDDSGKRCGGHDLALICYCAAANAKYDEDNQLICKGYRELDGTIRNNIGVNLDIDIVREIHNIRKENWIKTTKLMNKIGLYSKRNSIISSSSSGLLPSKIYSKCKYPERGLIGHPFNPVYLLPGVEIVPGKKTKKLFSFCFNSNITQLRTSESFFRRFIESHRCLSYRQRGR